MINFTLEPVKEFKRKTNMINLLNGKKSIFVFRYFTIAQIRDKRPDFIRYEYLKEL